MSHPLLRKLAALAEEDGLDDLTELFVAPGRSTLTSKLPARANDAVVNIHVADTESARAVGDSILSAARARFQRTAAAPTDAPAVPEVADGASALDQVLDRGFQAAGAALDSATRAPTPAAAMRRTVEAAAAEVAPRKLAADPAAKPAFAAAADAAKPAFAAAADAAKPAFAAAFEAAKPAEDPFALHLLPAAAPGAAMPASIPADVQRAIPADVQRAIPAELPGIEPAFAAAPTNAPAAAANDPEVSAYEGWPCAPEAVAEPKPSWSKAPQQATDARADKKSKPRHAAPAGETSDRPRPRADVQPQRPQLRTDEPSHQPRLRTDEPSHQPRLRADDAAPAARQFQAAEPVRDMPQASPQFRAAEPAHQQPIEQDGAARRATHDDKAERGAKEDQGAQRERKDGAPLKLRADEPKDVERKDRERKDGAPLKLRADGHGPDDQKDGAPASEFRAADDQKDGAPASKFRAADDQKDGAPASKFRAADQPRRQGQGPMGALEPFFDTNTPFSGGGGRPAPGKGGGGAPGPAPARPPAPAPAGPAPSGPAPAKGGGGPAPASGGPPADPEGKKQKVQEQAKQQKAAVTAEHQQAAQQASTAAQTERDTKFKAAEQQREAEQAKVKQAREAAKTEEKAAQATQEVTRKSLEQELAQAESREATELTQSRDTALADLDAKMENQRQRLVTEQQALDAKIDQELAAADKESAVASGKKSDELVKAQDENFKQLDKNNEERKQKNVKQAEQDGEKFKQEAKTEAEETRKHGDEEAKAVLDQANQAADAAKGEATAAKATFDAALAAANAITDATEKANKQAAAQTAYTQAITAANLKEANLRAEGEQASAGIKTKAMEKANEALASGDEKAKAHLTDVEKMNQALDNQLIMDKAQLAPKLMNDMAKLEADRQAELAKMKAKVEADRAAAKTEMATKTAQIETDRQAAITELDAKMTADLEASKAKAEAARAKLAATAEQDLAKAAQEVRAAITEIDAASDAADQRNTALVQQVETTVTTRVTSQISEMQATAAQALADIDQSTDQLLATIDREAKEMLEQQANTAAAVEKRLAATQAKIDQNRTKLADERSKAIADDAAKGREEVTDLREKKEENLDRIEQGLAPEEEKTEKVGPGPTNEEGGRVELDKLRKGGKLTDDQIKDAAKTASELRFAMETLTGTDEDKIQTLLAGKSPEEIKAIKAQFAAQGFGSLDAALVDEMSGSDLAEAQAKLSGDPVEAAVATLENAISGQTLGIGLGTDEAKIHEALGNIKDPETRAKVKAAYEKKTGESLDEALEDDLSGNAHALAKAMMEDDPVKREAQMAAVRLDEAQNGGLLNDLGDGLADGAGMAVDLVGGDGDAIEKSIASGLDTARDAVSDQLGISALEDKVLGGSDQAVYAELEKIKDPRVRAEVAKQYEAHTGRTLESDLTEEFGEGDPRRDAANAYLNGDVDAARAARFRAGADSFWGTDESEMYKQFEGLSGPERERVMAQVKAQEGGKRTAQDIMNDEMADTEHGGVATAMGYGTEEANLDKQKMEMLMKDGKVPPAFAIEHAIRGISTDDEALKKQLIGKSKAEIDAIAADYKKRFGKDLATEVLDENMGGRDDKLLELALKEGEPQTPEAKLKRMKDMNEFERGHQGQGLVGLFHGGIDEDVERQMRKAEELEKKLAQGPLSAADKQLLDDVTGYHDLALANNRAAQGEIIEIMNHVTDFVNVANPIGAALQRLSNKQMLMGNNYGTGEMLKDAGIEAAKLGVQALTAAVGGSGFMKALEGPVKEILMGALEGLLDGVIDAASDEKAMRDFGDFVKGLTVKGLGGAAKGAASAWADEVIGAGVEGLRDMFPNASSEMQARLWAAAQALAEGAAGAAIDPANYDKRIEDLMRTTGVDIAKDMFKGQQEAADDWKDSSAAKLTDRAREDAVADGVTDPAVVKQRVKEAAELGHQIDEMRANAGESARIKAESQARAAGQTPEQIELAGKEAKAQAGKNFDQKYNQPGATIEELQKGAAEAEKAKAAGTLGDPPAKRPPPAPPPPTAPTNPGRVADEPEPPPAPPAAQNHDHAVARANQAREDALAAGASEAEADQAYVDGLTGNPPKPKPSESRTGETDDNIARARRAEQEARARHPDDKDAADRAGAQAYMDALLGL